MNKKITFATVLILSFCRITFAREELSADLSGKVPSFTKANTVFQQSCVQCHSAQFSLPWYAHTPGIKSRMKREYRDSMSAFDLDSEVYVPGQPPTQTAIDGIERVAQANSRHPRTRVLTHWKAKLSRSSRADILNWIQDERSKALAQVQVAAIPSMTIPPLIEKSESVKPEKSEPKKPEVYNPFKPR